ncbi:MAG: hypothetical protein M0D55_06440 [Elusimicrobiota bacterium]|nr:MAG: hypothetical protein M0D55_06440 [Elusimicrobiota bacterium]
MITPRLALIALLAACAPALVRAESWDPTTQDADKWKAVHFTDELGDAKTYWFKSDALNSQGDKPLYILTAKENASVGGDNKYYESVTSIWVLRVKITAGGKGTSRKTLTVTRTGATLELPATAGITLGAHRWATEHPETKKEWRRGQGQIDVPARPYVAGTVKVVVAAPGEQTEQASSSPMTHYIVGVGPQNWETYYFNRTPAPKPAGRATDPDASYRAAMKPYAPLHRRVHPFEVVLNPNSCHVIPENCKDPKVPAYADFIKAAAENNENNALMTERLAVRGHAQFKAQAEAFKAEHASPPRPSSRRRKPSSSSACSPTRARRRSTRPR